MAVSLREYRARIKSTESMKKITRAMELIAASRIIKAQQRAQSAALGQLRQMRRVLPDETLRQADDQENQGFVHEANRSKP